VKNQFLQIKVFAKTLASEKKSIINTKSHFKKSHKLTKFLFNESLQGNKTSQTIKDHF